MAEDFTTLGGIVLAAGLSFGGAWLLFRRQLAAELATEKRQADVNAGSALLQRLALLENKLALVDQTVTPISVAMQQMLVKELTHMHTPEMDALLKKLGPPNTLTQEEADRLAILLKERVEDMGPEISDSERGAALILPEIIKRVVEEQQAAPEDIKLKVVSVPVAEEPEK